MAHARLMDALAPLSGRMVNAAAVGRSLLISHTTAGEWIRDLERLHQIWLVPPHEPRRKPLLVVRTPESPESRLVDALRDAPSVSHIRWWRSGKRPIVLVVDSGGERVGLCVATSVVLRRADWLPLIAAHRRGLVDRGLVLHAEAGATIKEGIVVALPLEAFVAAPEAWIRRTADERGSRLAAWQFNRERLARWRGHR